VSLKGETKLRGFIGQLAHLRPESAGRYGDVAGAEAEAVRAIGESFCHFRCALPEPVDTLLTGTWPVMVFQCR
jgi:hypothetical protein